MWYIYHINWKKNRMSISKSRGKNLKKELKPLNVIEGKWEEKSVKERFDKQNTKNYICKYKHICISDLTMKNKRAGEILS